MASRTKRTGRRKKTSGWRSILTAERVVIGGVIGFFVFFGLLIVIDSLLGRPPSIDVGDVPDNSVAYEIQDATHIQPGAMHPAYNSNPPTSGWHYPQDSALGVFTRSIVDETVVHNLEHGHVWLTYRDEGDEEALSALRAIQGQYPQHVIVTYRPENDQRIAAASWGYLLTLDELDTDQLQAFVVRHRDRAPESIPG